MLIIFSLNLCFAAHFFIFFSAEAKGSGKRFSRRIANRTRLSNIHRESDGKIAKKLEIELECSNQSNNVTNISSSATAPGHKQTTVIPVPPPPPPVLPPPPPPLPPSTRLPDQDVSKVNILLAFKNGTSSQHFQTPIINTDTKA